MTRRELLNGILSMMRHLDDHGVIKNPSQYGILGTSGNIVDLLAWDLGGDLMMLLI
jgi:hypothetical protein